MDFNRLKSSLKDMTGDLAASLSDKAADLRENPAVSAGLERTSDLVRAAKRESDNRGVTDKAVRLKEATQGKLDAMTGVEMYEQVQAWIDEQHRFNNVVASKLHEAIREVERLRARIAELEASDSR